MNGLYDSGISRRHMVLVTGAREWIFIFLSFFLFFFFVSLSVCYTQLAVSWADIYEI